MKRNQKINMQVEIKDNKIFIPLENIWIKNTPEEKLKQEFICRLVNSYGYSIKQLGQDVAIKKRYKADIAIWRSEKDKIKNAIPSIIITVECKAEHIKIKESDYSIGYNFASSINANFFIAVNLKEARVFHIKKDSALKQMEKLSDIPNAEILSDDLKIDQYIKETKSFTKEEFTKLLSRCHNIIRNNDKLSPEASFDEISKILFMKIMYERNATEEMIFSKAKFQTEEMNYEKVIRPTLKKDIAYLDQDYMQFLFDQTKKSFENDGLFEAKDQIRIKKNSFEQIVEELERFNLSDTSDDVKGLAFEQFLGKTFRGELGQFFTPRTVVDFMIEILDPQEDELICDPCCGSGGFLITAFEYIRSKIDENIKTEIQRIKEKYFDQNYENLPLKKQQEIDSEVQRLIQYLNAEFDIKNTQSRYHNLSHNCIYGIDANPRMARTAKMNMIMHGDGHGGVHHHDGLLNINGIYENRFDIILTNPPFGARVDKASRVSVSDIPSEDLISFYAEKYKGDYISKVINPLKEWVVFDNGDKLPKGKSILDLYETGSMSTLTEVLFIERCLNLLKPGGRMGIVLPEGVLNNTNLQKIREFVESRAKILLITSIPQDVFIASGATVKPSLLFFKKFTKEETKQWKRIASTAEKEITKKYEPQKKAITELLNQKGKEALSAEDKKKLRADLKQIEEIILIEIKAQIKKEFNYQISIAEVENAGISSTGVTIPGNELVSLAEEFKIYRENNILWTTNIKEINYQIANNELVRVRIVDGVVTESEVFYNKLQN